MTHRHTPLLVLLLLAAACHTAQTEQRTLDLAVEPIFHSNADPLGSGDQILQGSRICFEIDAVLADGSWVTLDTPSACYDTTLVGPIEGEGLCATLEQTGWVGADYTPRDQCPYESVRSFVVPDRIRLEVVPPIDLRAKIEWPLESVAQRGLHPGPRGAFPSDWITPPGEPLRLVPDREVGFAIVVTDSEGRPIAWDPSQGELLAMSSGGATRSVGVDPDVGSWPIASEVGSVTRFALARPMVAQPVIEVVAAEAPASIEIVAAYETSREFSDPAWGNPIGARAVVRDAHGNVVVGAPVEWDLVEGQLALTHEWGPLSPPEYVDLHDGCVPKPTEAEPRRAVLRARLDELEDTLELEWTARPPGRRPTSFSPSEGCVFASPPEAEPRGCGCSSAPAPVSALVLGPWLLLLLRRRLTGQYPLGSTRSRG